MVRVYHRPALDALEQLHIGVLVFPAAYHHLAHLSNGVQCGLEGRGRVGRGLRPLPVHAGQAPGGEPVARGLAEEELLCDIDLSHDQGGETALVEEYLGGLGVTPVDGRRGSVPEGDEMAEGPAQVVPPEAPASQER